MSHQDAIVALGKSLYTTGNPAIQKLTSEQVTEAFVQTLQDLKILIDEGETPSKDQPMYKGLLWLKERADRLDIIILVPTELNYDWVQEILQG